MKKSKLLLKILKDPRFIAGIDKGIETTNRTGYETQFSIATIPTNSRIIYPNEIKIGDIAQVGSRVAMERIKTDFTAIYGREPGKIEKDSEFREFYLKLYKEQRAQSVNYPISQDDPDLFENSIPKDDYGSIKFVHSLRDFLGFHTHPSYNANPSGPDSYNTKFKDIGLVVASKPIDERHNFSLYSGSNLSRDDFILSQVFGVAPTKDRSILIRGVYEPNKKRFKVLETCPFLEKKTGKISLKKSSELFD